MANPKHPLPRDPKGEIPKNSPEPAQGQKSAVQTVKMVVTGPFNAGKTEFIRSVSEIDVVSTERKISSSTERSAVTKESTTVAMDFGRITVDDDLVLYLFGTPGQKRFEFMWEILSEGMLGFIVMVDSTRPETFREARSILETFRAYAPTPYVVAANKQDMPDAWEIEDMRIALRLDDQVRMMPCSATNKETVKNVLLELLYSILAEMEESGD
jgi:small GTP-binding protein